MIIVRILGGLGNQMFQYAYAKALSLDGYKVKLDLSKVKKYKLHGGYQLDKYKIDLNLWYLVIIYEKKYIIIKLRDSF